MIINEELRRTLEKLIDKYDDIRFAVESTKSVRRASACITDMLDGDDDEEFDADLIALSTLVLEEWTTENDYIKCAD